MFAAFFALLAGLDWFIVSRKSSRKKERLIVLLILLATSMWNLAANLIAWWPNPFDLIHLALSWM